jgi:hypothetical protein
MLITTNLKDSRARTQLRCPEGGEIGVSPEE